MDFEFVLEESLGNELDSDDESLKLLLPEPNYHVAENPTIKKTLEEASSKSEKKVVRKIKKRQRKAKGQRKTKRQRKKQVKK